MLQLFEYEHVTRRFRDRGDEKSNGADNVQTSSGSRINKNAATSEKECASAAFLAGDKSPPLLYRPTTQGLESSHLMSKSKIRWQETSEYTGGNTTDGTSAVQAQQATASRQGGARGMAANSTGFRNSPFFKQRKAGKPAGTKRPKTKGEVRTTMATTSYRAEHPSTRTGKGRPPFGSDTIQSHDQEERSHNHVRKVGSLDPDLLEMNVGTQIIGPWAAQAQSQDTSTFVMRRPKRFTTLALKAKDGTTSAHARKHPTNKVLQFIEEYKQNSNISIHARRKSQQRNRPMHHRPKSLLMQNAQRPLNARMACPQESMGSAPEYSETSQNGMDGLPGASGSRLGETNL